MGYKGGEVLGRKYCVLRWFTGVFWRGFVAFLRVGGFVRW